MRLILFRHGLAVDRDDFIQRHQDDSLRPLVQKGRERTKDMAKYLRDWDLNFDLIVTSPFKRAAETAEILKQSLKVSNLFEAPELVPSSSPQAFAQWLRIHAEDCLSVLAVGHEPHLSTFATWCLSGQKETFFDLKKSGAMALEVESFSDLTPGSARLLWHISPKLFGKS